MAPPLKVLLLAAAAISTAAVAWPLAAGAATPHPLQTAVMDRFYASADDESLALDRIKAAGAVAFRTDLDWGNTAPRVLPDKFNARDPDEKGYRWAAIDARVRALVAHGLEPILWVFDPPVWAGGGYFPSPDAKALQQFMYAVALRYSGHYKDFPRVRYFQVWNEPNVKLFFDPRFTGAPVTPPALYRLIVNGVAEAVHSVHPDNLVIAGALSPFAVPSGDTKTIAPLNFERDLLCLSDGAPPVATCHEQIHFDVWAEHPYTRGGPTTKASNPGDASLGDLPAARDILQAAISAGSVVSAAPVQTWVTEFSWDTNPPDSLAVPIHLQSRWVSEALYQMWNAGISLVTWLNLRDEPFPQKPVQSGLYFRGGTALSCDAPKPTLTSFEFPFVAYKQRGNRILVWGRTPGSTAGRVVIERAAAKRWRKVGALQADQYGIFQGVIRKKVPRGSFIRPPLVFRSPSGCPSAAFPAGVVRTKGTKVKGRYLRARVARVGSSLPFSLAVPKNRVYNPFG